MKEIGALWKQISKAKNTEYLSGNVDIDGVKMRIIVFKNEPKLGDRHPDWKIYLSDPKPETAEERPQYGYRDTTKNPTTSAPDPARDNEGFTKVMEEKDQETEIDLSEEKKEINVKDIPF